MRSSLGPASAEIARWHGALTRTSLIWVAVACCLGATALAHAQTNQEEAPETVGPAAAEFETVVRTSSADITRALLDDSASASVITRDRTPQSGESLPGLLAEIPSVTVTRLGGLGSLATVALRGSTANQVLVYVDGVPLNSIVGTGVDLSTIPIGDIERIEIYRGMSPIAFGASALGGVVSITTQDANDTSAAAAVGAGSFATHIADAHGSFAGERLRLYAGANWLDSSGAFNYRNDGGTAFNPADDIVLQRQNNARQQFGGLVRGHLRLGAERELRAATSFFTQRQGLPGIGNYPTSLARVATDRVISTLTYKSRGEISADDSLRFLVFGMRGRKRLHDPLAEIEPLRAETNDLSTSFGGNVLLNEPLLTWLTLNGIVDGRYESLEPYDALAAIPRGQQASRISAASGVDTEITNDAKSLSLTPSMRLEWSRDLSGGRGFFGETRDAGPAITHTLPLTRLAALARPRQWVTLRANVARYARLASAVELYGNDGFVLGNPELLPELGYNADLGASIEPASNWWHGTLDCSAFASRVTNLIQFSRTNNGMVRAFNVGRARIVGVEAAGRLLLGSHIRVTAQSTFTDARNLAAARASFNKQLPLRPRLHSFARAELQGIPIGDDLEAGAYVDTDMTSGNYADPANQVRFKARWFAGAGAHIATFGGQLRLVVSGQNLGNTQSSDAIGYPLPGRAVFVTLSAKTSSKKDSE